MPTTPIVQELRERALFLWLVWLSLLLCFVLVQPAQFIHPFTWGDDVAWEVDPAFYVGKLRQEGRWIVFAWIRAFGHGSAAFDFTLLIGLWCGAALTVASAAAGTRSPFMPLLAIALAVSPSAWALTLWPHTVLPMFAVLAICGLGVALAEDGKSRLRALFAGMAATVLSYQLFSFYLLGAVLVVLVLGQAKSGDPLPIRRLVPRIGVPVAVGAAGMIAGVVVQYGLNALAFGRFGLEEAGWRAGEADALGAGSRPELAFANLRLNLSWLNGHLMGRLPLVALTAAAGLVAAAPGSDAWRRRRLSLHVAVLAAVAVAPLAIPLGAGAILPADRGSLNLWLALVAALALPIMTGAGVAARRIAGAGLLLLVVSSVQSLSLSSSAYERHREQNAAVLDQLAARTNAGGDAAGSNGTFIQFIGRTKVFEGPAGDADWFGLMLIRRRLGERKLGYCARIATCPDLAGSEAGFARMPSFPAPGSVAADGARLVVKLGPLAAEPPAGR